jgi:glycosyltransferase involved in cell wall biosynthesis
MVLLEASARAVPIVATNVDGVPELILDGVSGLLYYFGDDKALVQALRDLAIDPAKAARIGSAGSSRVQSHFSEEQFLKKMTAVYEAASMQSDRS